jgi:hypothetical protein
VLATSAGLATTRPWDDRPQEELDAGARPDEASSPSQPAAPTTTGAPAAAGPGPKAPFASGPTGRFLVNGEPVDGQSIPFCSKVQVTWEVAGADPTDVMSLSVTAGNRVISDAQPGVPLSLPEVQKGPMTFQAVAVLKSGELVSTSNDGAALMIQNSDRIDWRFHYIETDVVNATSTYTATASPTLPACERFPVIDWVVLLDDVPFQTGTGLAWGTPIETDPIVLGPYLGNRDAREFKLLSVIYHPPGTDVGTASAKDNVGYGVEPVGCGLEGCR